MKKSAWPTNLLEAINREKCDDIEDIIHRLSDRELGVVLLYYKEQLTLDVIGTRFHVTRERIRQILKRALNKLNRQIMSGSHSKDPNGVFIIDAYQEGKLSTHAANCLIRMGFERIGEIIDGCESVEDLLLIRNVGIKTANEIINCLIDFGFEKFSNGTRIHIIEAEKDG